jgi:hypothetical protein
MQHLGDFAVGATIDLKFTTVNTSGVPTQLAGSPAAHVYKANGTTENNTGLTLTVDFDARTGLNHVRIDTSQDATFYAAGGEFQVVLTTGTVGGSSVVGYVVGTFSLRNRSLENRVPAALVGGRMDSSIGAVAAGAITAAAFAANALDAVWSATTRTLTSFGTLVADIWNHITRTLTAAAESTSVQLVDPSSGDITIYAGDDYDAADAGRVIQWVRGYNTWPDLTGAALTLKMRDAEDETVKFSLTSGASELSVQNAGTATQTIRIDVLTAANTALLTKRGRKYRLGVQAVVGGDTFEVVDVWVNVRTKMAGA